MKYKVRTVANGGKGIRTAEYDTKREAVGAIPSASQRTALIRVDEKGYRMYIVHTLK